MHSELTKPDQRNHQLAVERCHIVRDWLEDSKPKIDQSIEELIRVVELLDNDSTPKANKIRELAGELWRILSIKLDDVETARETLLKGLQLFGSTPAAQTLEEMLYLAEQGCIIHRSLEVTPDEQWPVWLVESDAPQRLTRLVKAFDVLLKSAIWSNLRARRDQYYQEFIEKMLPAYLETLYKSARQYGRDRNFAMATLTVENALKLLRHEIRPYLQLSFTEDELHQFKEALAIREQAEVTLWKAAVRLTDPETTFSDVIPGISMVNQNHPDIPEEDLNTLLADLYQGEKIEALYAQTSDLENFTKHVTSFQAMGEVSFSILTELPEYLQQADIRLANKLQARFKLLADSFNRATDKTALTLANRIQEELSGYAHGSDPHILLRYYWQAYWCQISGVIKEKSVVNTLEETLNKTESGLDSLLQRSAEKFINLASPADLDQILLLLESFRVLNLGMVHNLSHNQILIHQLPPLPDGVDFPETYPKYEDAILEKWAVIIKSWRDQVNEQQIQDQAETNGVGGFQRAKEFVFEMLRDLSVLKKDVWSSLNLNEWSENTGLGGVSIEIIQLHQLIIVLSDLDRSIVNKSPLDVQVYLDEQIRHSGLLEQIETHSSWLLETHRNHFLENLKDRYHNAHKGVNQLISNLLKEKSGVIQQFREEILAKPQVLATAEYLFEAIYSITDRLAQAYFKSGDVAEALSIWDFIREATLPWSTHKEKDKAAIQLKPEVEELWRKLHKKTYRTKLKLILISRKREISASVAIIVLVIIIWIGINTLFLGPRKESFVNNTAVVTTPTTDIRSTDTYKATEAKRADLAETGTAQQLSIQETGAAELNLTATARVLNNQIATQEAAESLSGTGTAVANAIAATATANQEISLANAATGTAMVDSIRCLDVANFALALSSELELDPPIGTSYIIGTAPIYPVAMWEITNIGICEWEEILVKSITGVSNVSVSIWRGFQQVLDLSDQPVGIDESLKIALNFDILDTNDVHGEWVLVINGLEITEGPHLILDMENWINLIAPPSSRP